MEIGDGCERETNRARRGQLGVGGVVRGEAGSGWLGENRGSRKRAEKESKKRAKRESIGVKCFGKWFTENFFVNRFPNFCEGFSDQLQTISVDFYFTAKQTPANDENVLRKIFYVETNRAEIYKEPKMD